MGLVVFQGGLVMMDTVWIQQSLPFSFNFKDLIRLNTIREPSVPFCCCCYCSNHRFLNQKLQTVGLTRSQGLGMQKQIQGTDELQMWTGFRGLNRVCQVTQGYFLPPSSPSVYVHTRLHPGIFLFALDTPGLSQSNWNSDKQLLQPTIKTNNNKTQPPDPSQQPFGLLYSTYKKRTQTKLKLPP